MLTETEKQKILKPGKDRNDFIVDKLLKDQKLVEGDLSKINEVLDDWRSMYFITNSLDLIFNNINSISHRILNTHKCYVLGKVNFEYVVSNTQINLFLEYLYHCLNNHCFSVSDIKLSLKILKKYINHESTKIKHFAIDCIGLCRESLSEIKKMNLIRFNGSSNEREFVYVNTSKKRLLQAREKGAKEIGLNNFDINFESTYTCKFISKDNALKLVQNGFHDSQFSVNPFSNDGFICYFKDFVAINLFCATLADKSISCYIDGNSIPTIYFNMI